MKNRGKGSLGSLFKIGLGYALSLVAHGQSVDLGGMVKDKAGNGIAGAVVTLIGKGLKDTSDAQGNFQIRGQVTALPGTRLSRMAAKPAYRAGRGLGFGLSSQGWVSLRVFDLAGNNQARFQGELQAGNWELGLGRLPAGAYLGILETAAGRESFRFAVAEAPGVRTENREARLMPVAADALALGKAAAPAAVDSLRAVKAPYAQITVGVSSLLESNITLTLDSASTLSTGCGKTITRPDPGARQTLQVSGTARTYQLFIPSNYSPNAGLPVIFAFHGAGGNGAQARSDFKLEAAVANGAILVYPDGGWSYVSGTDVAFFDALVQDLQAKYCIDTRRVFAAGFSLGGIMSNGLGCLRGGGSVRGIVAIATSGPNPNPSPATEADVACPSGTPTGDVATLIIHGSADDIALYKYAQWGANYWRKWNGCSATSAASPSPFSGCVDYPGGRAPVTFCTHSGGHMVPANAGSYIWEFAKRLK